MTVHYSVESLLTLFLSDEYISDKNIYQRANSNKLKEVSRFLNSIEINKNYYKTGFQVKNPRYKKKVSDDTVFIKNFNSSLNKISGINYEKLSQTMLIGVATKSHIYPLLLQSILEQSLLHHTYIKYYVHLIDLLHKQFNNSQLIYSQLDSCYEKIIAPLETNDTQYSQLCAQNKQVDQLIGYSILLSELEVKSIIKNKIDTSIQRILDTMKREISEDKLYQCVLCLYNIFKVKYSTQEINPDYTSALIEIKENIKFMKIKFKIMDILERK